LNKTDIQDILAQIYWGNATEITEITGKVLNTMETFYPADNEHYLVNNNRDGTGLLTITTEL